MWCGLKEKGQSWRVVVSLSNLLLILNFFCFQQPVLGKLIQRPAKLDKLLQKELLALAHADDPYDTVVAKTMCTPDFYEGI